MWAALLLTGEWLMLHSVKAEARIKHWSALDNEDSARREAREAQKEAR